ncbi:MAG TPA: carbamoyltransferase HypF [Chthoniobacterales bacterium]|jgi:hydrogenase maturation protein HypF
MKRQRIKIAVRGAVQGVGFRPFVYRLATELQLAGWVLNSSQGVLIEAEGPIESLQRFVRRLQEETPQHAVVQSLESSFLDPVGYASFKIRESSDAGGKTALILPDIATCSECLREILDPHDRRYRYPFTNCTNCGPRFSIIEVLPYDRANTSMKSFAMCEDCAREYSDPRDRRFHAEPTACPRCGPSQELWDSTGNVVAKADDALLQTAAAIRRGQIVALKGLGGFQLIVDAWSEEAVSRLRVRKQRAEKPFVVMFPTLEKTQAHCAVSDLEKRLLLSPESPIVLIPHKAPRQLADSVSPGNPNCGVMLPYTPLHHLLMRELDCPVVATSGNLSDEPICIDEREALERLRDIADCFLVHNRPIVRHVDDSIVRVVYGREMILRRARGYAPLPITLPRSQPSVLAVGAHLKNTVALSVDRNVFISQHIGDLATKQAHDAFSRSAADLPRLYETQPEVIAHDLHPEYLSTKYARERPGRHVPVQHHWAHVAACMAENEIEPPALGIAWDGTGYGTDGTIWGGEFLRATPDGSFERVAHLRTFSLPGGDQAVKEPRRSALGLLYELKGEQLWQGADFPAAFAENEEPILRQMLRKQINCPITSSAGRLFDAVAALIGLRQKASFEGQAAMQLEFAADPEIRDAYPFSCRVGKPAVIDWDTSVAALLGDIRERKPPGVMAAKFHNTLVEMIVAVARLAAEPKVLLSGGCFQNRLLSERAIARLRKEGFQPYWHRFIPPNDGGISFGQVVAAAGSLR